MEFKEFPDLEIILMAVFAVVMGTLFVAVLAFKVVGERRWLRALTVIVLPWVLTAAVYIMFFPPALGRESPVLLGIGVLLVGGILTSLVWAASRMPWPEAAEERPQEELNETPD